MPIVLGDLLAHPTLGLVVRTDDDGRGRPVSWVHVSESPDPAPFLDGGELLLTTGQFTGGVDADGYVARLVEAGVTALGFGVGLPHPEVPGDLLAAANLRGLPVLEVPLALPFIAISKAVSRALAADEYAAKQRAFDAQSELTRSALGTTGRRAVVTKVGRYLNAWAVLVDAAGAPIHASPASAARHLPALAAELDKARRGSGPSSMALVSDAGCIVIHPIRGSRQTHGFLVVGRADPVTAAERHVLNTAVSLITLASEQSHAQEIADGRLRRAVLHLLLSGQAAEARHLAQQLWDDLPPAPIRIFAFRGSGQQRKAAEDLITAEARSAAEPIFHVDTGQLTLLAVTDGRALSGWLPGLPSRLGGLTLGISAACGYDGLEEAHDQALQALAAARRAGKDVQRHDDVGSGTLEHLVGPDNAAAFATAQLAPLLRHDEACRGNLVASLRAWLEHHGQWDPTAHALGVHRHTVRNRITKVQDLLGRSLELPGVRAELWIALQCLTADRSRPASAALRDRAAVPGQRLGTPHAAPLF